MKMVEKVQRHSMFLQQTAGDFRKLLLWYFEHRTDASHYFSHVPRHKLSFKRLEVTDETRQRTKRQNTLMELSLSTSRNHKRGKKREREIWSQLPTHAHRSDKFPSTVLQTVYI
jgi:hypothetical protein